jgi:hypothetical protein
MKPTIDELLTRYYDGETTLDEEKQLRNFFRHPSGCLTIYGSMLRCFTT